MLILSEALMQALDDYAYAAFLTRMQAHARHFFPAVCAALAEAALADLVRRAVEEARARGLQGKQDICRYLNLVLLLGADFAAPTGYAWARQVVEDPYVRSGAARLALLEAAAERMLATRDGVA